MNGKEYILSIQAQLKGDKVVITGLKSMEGETQKFSQTVNLTGKKTQDYSDILAKAGQRALIVAPIWLAIRSAMMLGLSVISAMIKANFDLEEGMARIQTVIQGTTSEINAQMIGIKRTILDTSLTTKISIKDLAEAFYFLKTSALTAEETMAGFQPVVNIMTGTSVGAKEASRALAGMYNTMGKSIGENLSVSEKMIKIADILTYTYAKQDAEMGELIAGYSKLAPYLAGLDDSFIDIISTLGFLNTHLLKAGRTGTLTGQAIMNMTKSAKDLASIFGITFDPNQPMNFLKTIGQIQKTMTDTTKLTTAQSEAIRLISASKGGVPLRLILGNYDEFKATLKDASENFEGFAKKIADIKMNTVTAQMAEMQNILAVLTNDFISGVYGVSDFAEALKLMNTTMIELRPNIQGLGMQIGWLGDTLGKLMLYWDILSKINLPALANNPFIMLNTTIENTVKSLKELKYVESLKSPVEYAEEQLAKQAKGQQITAERKKTLEELSIKEKQASDFKISGLKIEREEMTHNIAILKIMGANELDIAKYKLQSLETIKSRLTEQDYILEKQKNENELIRTQLEYRKEIVNVYQKASLDLLKTTGASESQILTVRMKILETNRQDIGDAQFLSEMEDLRLQRVISIENERRKELEIQSNLVRRYYEADNVERGRLKRMMELRQLPVEQLARQWEENMFDRGIIEQYFSDFSQKGQQAVNTVMAKMFEFELPTMSNINIEGIPDLFKSVFSPDTVSIETPKASIFWDTWNTRQADALDIFGKEWSRMSKGFVGVEGYATAMTKQAIQQNVDLGTQIDKIEINLPANALDDVATSASNKLKQELETNSELQKKLGKVLRPYL